MEEEVKLVKIYSRGGTPMNDISYFCSALEYKGHYKYITGRVSGATPAQCILIGLAEAINLLKFPCSLEFVVADRFSFNKQGEPRGRNKEIKSFVFDLATKKGCDYKFIFPVAESHDLKSKLEFISDNAVHIAPSLIGIESLIKNKLL